VVPAAGVTLYYLDIGGIRGKNLKTMLLAPFKLLRALIQALVLMQRLKPRAVLGMGGFVSGPGGVAAWLLRIPLLIHEQNAIAGLTNRLLAPLATHVLQAFPGTFAPARRAHTCGNPLRRDFGARSDTYQVHTPLRILVLGGSLGAQALNECVPIALAQVNMALLIRHQSGRGKQQQLQQRYNEQQLNAQVDEFIEDMPAAYLWADVVIARAGALTLSELAHSGRPAILVPFPHAVDDHQSANAAVLVRAGAAYLLPQKMSPHAAPLAQHLLTPCTLAALIEKIAPAELTTMATAARHCARPNATCDIVALCLATAPQ
jgi:UDP-N-acetylglucosamine--N-acetylmuramyl-(pentapeptide) pyrophosphoryl-undecaprenol N-acetylglucosamine transferase